MCVYEQWIFVCGHSIKVPYEKNEERKMWREKQSSDNNNKKKRGFHIC